MPNLLVPRPWTSQPQFATGINWANPITQGLTSANLPGVSRFDAVSGLQLSTASGTNTPSISTSGRVLQATASQSSVYTTASPAQLTASGSILWAGDLYAIPSGDGCLGGITYNSANSNPYVMLELKRSTTASNYGIYLAHSIGGNSNNVSSANNAGAPGNGYCYVGTATSGQQILYAGKIGTPAVGVSSTAYSGALSSTSTSRIEIGDSLNARNPQSACAVMLMWNRVLSPAEVASISTNPWQIFRPNDAPTWGNV